MIYGGDFLNKNKYYIIRYWLKNLIIGLLKFSSIFIKVKKKKILFISYFGNAYSCSPRCISEYLQKNVASDYELIWAFNDMSLGNDEIVKVKINSLKYFYHVITTQIIISNCRTNDFIFKRKEQYYIQTWHSSLRLKKIEKDAIDTLGYGYVNNAIRDSKKCDLLIAGSAKSQEILESSFWYNGEIMKSGTPRNDIFFKEKNLYNIKKMYSGKKIILYAPTFRKDNNIDVYDLEYEEILRNIEKINSDEWIFIIKFHPNIIEKFKNKVNYYTKKIIDGNNFDIQELLIESDILITDYSSLMFDFILTKKPCYLYTPDLDEYMNSDRGLYFEFNELPFSISKDTKELVENMSVFNSKEYRKEINSFLERIENFEDGRATERIVNRIEEVCNNGRR